MKIKSKVFIAKDNRNVLGFGSVEFESDGFNFVVTGVRLIKSKNGNSFVSMPCKKNNQEEYKDICYPLNKNTRDAISDSFKEAYKKLTSQTDCANNSDEKVNRIIDPAPQNKLDDEEEFPF